MANNNDMDVDTLEADDVVDLTNSDVVTKYMTAADIVNKALGGIVTYSKAGMRTTDVCVFGDTVITQLCANVYKAKKKLQKGIAFPTCISVNQIVCHYSPLRSDNQPDILKSGDMVKIDLGVHVDGFIAVAAHTFIVPLTDESEQAHESRAISGRKADVIKAAWTGAEAAVKLIKPGATNKEITDMLTTVMNDFDVSLVQGVLMHELKQFVIDGNNVIIQREDIEQKVDLFEFEKAHVYTVDVCMSTGSGKPIERQERPTVFKRALDQDYDLKVKASRYLFREVNRRFTTFPFTLRSIDDERQARMGVVECVKRDLFTPYPVLSEKPGDFVAHFKFTVLLLPSGTVKITGLPANQSEWQSDKVVSDTIASILALSAKTKKKKKNKKKAEEENLDRLQMDIGE